MPITVDRGGVTAAEWYETGIPANAEMVDNELKLCFELDSKGGGQTEVRVNINVDSFEQLLTLMLACNFDRTITAFGKAVKAVHRQRGRGV